MRITNSIVFTNMLSQIQRLNQDIFKYNEQVTSGKRINRPSDDPVGSTMLASIKSEIASLNQYVENIQNANRRMEASDSRLNDVSLALTRVIELNTQAANEQNTGVPRTGIAREVESIVQELLGHADAQVGGRSIFAGTRNTVDALKTIGGNPEGRVYSASSVDIQSASAGTITGAVADPGFFTEHIYQIRFTDGAGNFEIIDLDGDSQVVANGTFAAPGDTISFGGVTYTYGGGALAPGDVFTVLPQYSYNGTSTRIQMQVDENATVPQNVPGSDPFGGTDPVAGVQQPGGTVFDDLVELRRALLTNDEDAIVQSLDTVRGWYDNLGQVRANLGGRISNLRALEVRGAAEVADLKVHQAAVENVNLAEAITNFSQSQSGLQAALQVGALVGRTNLFDFLG